MKYEVYGDIRSGNCYKIKLLMSFLGIDHQWHHIDILANETETPEFRAMNINAKIPVLKINDKQILFESNAILNYLAEGSCYLHSSKYEHSQVLQWQFFEQYSHEPYIATARYINKYLGLPKERLEEYKGKQEGGHKALAVMESHLKIHQYFVSDRPTIADISLYAYTHVASEGGFSLDSYPNICRWIADIKKLPNYRSMKEG